MAGSVPVPAGGNEELTGVLLLIAPGFSELEEEVSELIGVFL